MVRENDSSASTVVIVVDGETDDAYRLARRLLADGCRVAVVARLAGEAVRVMHGHSADRVMVIAADSTDQRQWSRVTDRVVERFGRIDTVVHAENPILRASA